MLKTAGVLTIGTDNPAYPPWFGGGETKGAKWKLNDPATGKGFESAVAYAVASQLGFTGGEVHWVVVPFNSALKPGKKSFDFFVKQVSYLPERAKNVDFSASYYDVNQAVVAIKGKPGASANSVAALKKLKLGAKLGTTSYRYIIKHIKPSTSPSVYDSSSDAVTALKNGKIDGLVVDLPTAFDITAGEVENGVIVRQFPPVGGQERFGLVLGKGSALTACVTKALAALKANGTLKRLQQQWLATATATATTAPVLQATFGWTYHGVFPVSAKNISTLRRPDKTFVAYYTSTNADSPRGIPRRAFSPDGLKWTQDTTWACTVFCDFPDGAAGLPSMPHLKILRLKDGGYRAYVKAVGKRSIESYRSPDGLAWTKESGTRFSGDASLEFESGNALVDFFPVYLTDDATDRRVRAYYQGSKSAGPGDKCGNCYVILSALSTDDGLTFAREPGIRLDPRTTSQVFDYGGWGFADAKVLRTKNGFRAIFGNYVGPVGIADSAEGLAFTWQGFAPLWGYNAEAVDLGDGRIVLLGGSYGAPGSALCPIPGGCHSYWSLIHILLWEPLHVAISVGKWDNAGAAHGKTTISVTGSAGGLARLKVIDGAGQMCPWDASKQTNVWNDGCYFHPDYYRFAPSSGTVPFQSSIARTPPANASKDQAAHESETMVGVEVDGRTIVTMILCVNRSRPYANCP